MDESLHDVSEGKESKNNVNNEIVKQLQKFDYEYNDIIKAINSTNNKNDINEIINQIEKQNIIKQIEAIVPNENQAENILSPNNNNENEIINFDFSPFESNKVNITCKSIEDGCICIERMLYALKYYSLLNIMDNNNGNNNQEKFTKFVKDIYKLLPEDYMHIIDKHNNELDNIYKLMIGKYNFNPCNINNCSLIIRHNRNRNYNKNKIINDESVLFYMDLLDTMHNYFVHLEDVGMRTKKINRVEMDKNYENESQYSYYDEQFANICNTIKIKQQKLKRINGFNNRFENNNKFNIKINNNNNNSNAIDKYGGTFLDGIFKHIISNDDEIISKLKYMLMKEEFDSDAVENDVEYNNGKQSNINQYLNDKNVYYGIKRSINYCKNENMKHGNMFSIGYRFYYWDYYKKDDINKLMENDSVNEGGHNINNHNGYKISELFVIKKYKNIKTEILQNKIYTLHIFEWKTTAHKVKTFIKTTKVKSMKSWTSGGDRYHYDIPNGSRMKHAHLLSICLYCDWTNLSKEFSLSFRKTNTWETIELIKNKNSQFAHWAKALRETVEYFGTNNEKPGYNYGPFYSGLSIVLIIPQFSIRLNSPTSTTKKIEVSMRFGGKNGCIIQLNNNGSYKDRHHLKSFSCHFISNYPEEYEFLFCGGAYRNKIENIRNLKTKQNFQQFFKILFYFDCMIHASGWDRKNVPNITRFDYKILKGLINHKLDTNEYENKFDSYINNTFQLYTNNQKQIIINVYIINHQFKRLQELIIHPSLELSKTKTESKQSIEKHNVFKTEMLELFPNINHIVIHAGDYNVSDHKTYEYPFDFILLLNIISNSLLFKINNLKITIKGEHKYGENWRYIGCSWLSNVLSKNIIKEFNNMNLNVDLETKSLYVLGHKYMEDNVTITSL